MPGLSGEDLLRSLQEGDGDDTVWCPGETDVSIRAGWFHHPAQAEKVRSVDDLVNIFFTSVGRNSKLLLNVPPTRDGLLHATDVERLLGMRAQLDGLFTNDLARGGVASWSTGAGGTAVASVARDGLAVVGVVDPRECIEQG